ncbi:MAG: hypothetical protein IKF09_10440, partial [Clostridiales bacterium]|nr:hypothetical protein [Clostridiales bacterium]
MSPYVKTILRSVRMTMPRFIAIFAIIALGVGFFAGLKVTTPSFVATADRYVSDYALFDFEFLSTIGFTDDDIAKLQKRTDCVVEGSYSGDCSAVLGDSPNADTVRFISITENVNKICLESGRLPLRDDEVVIDGYRFPTIEEGTKIVISDETSPKALDLFKYREYTVVGTARSPLYMNFQRGSSDEGSGSITYYVCALPGAFDSEYYTEAYLYADTGLYIYSDEYKTWAGSAEKQYKVILKSVIGDRFEALLKEEYDKLYDGVDEFNEGIDDARKEISDARKELDDAKKKLEDAQIEVDKHVKELEEGKETLDKSRDQLSEYQSELAETKAALDEAGIRAESGKAELDSLKEDIDDLYEELSDERSELRNSRIENQSRTTTLEYLISTYETAITLTEAGIVNNRERLEEAESDWEKQFLESQIASQEEAIENYRQLIEDAEAEIAELEEEAAGFDDIQKQIDAKKKIYDEKIAEYNGIYKTYMSDKIQYEMGLSSYESS